MNLNSEHQRWSLWEYRVYPTGLKAPNYATVKTNAARFGRLVFGSASTMRIHCGTDDYGRPYWEVAVLTEGHPVHDPQYTEWMHDKWRKFFLEGFGPGCPIHAHARLEAGDRQDGRPADQLIVLPGIRVEASERA